MRSKREQNFAIVSQLFLFQTLPSYNRKVLVTWNISSHEVHYPIRKDMLGQHNSLFISLYLDPCSSNPCQNGGLCQSTNSTFDCICPLGFSGLSCSKGKNTVV